MLNVIALLWAFAHGHRDPDLLSRSQHLGDQLWRSASTPSVHSQRVKIELGKEAGAQQKNSSLVVEPKNVKQWVPWRKVERWLRRWKNADTQRPIVSPNSALETKTTAVSKYVKPSGVNGLSKDRLKGDLQDWQLHKMSYYRVVMLVFGQLAFVLCTYITLLVVLGTAIYYLTRMETFEPSDGSVQEKFEQFKAERSRQKRILFWRVILLGISLMLIGNSFATVTAWYIVKAKPYNRIIEEAWARFIPVLPLSSIVRNSGLVVISTLPIQYLDVDHMTVESPHIGFVIGVVLMFKYLGYEHVMTQRDVLKEQCAVDRASAYGVVQSMGSHLPEFVDCFLPVPICYGLLILQSLLAVIGQLCNIWPKFTTLYSISVMFLTFGYGIHYTMEGLEDMSGCKCSGTQCHGEEINGIALSKIWVGISMGLAVAFIASKWFQWFHMAAACKGQDRFHPTVNMYYVFYICSATRGCAKVLTAGAMFILATEEDWRLATNHESNHPWWRLQRVEDGLFQAVLPLLVIALSRERAFRALDGFFEKKRAEADGAFMAELLEHSGEVEVGQSWWLHHGADHTSAWGRLREEVGVVSFGEFDARRNWHAGVIVNVETKCFDVQLRSSLDVTKVIATQRVQRPEAGLSATELLELAKKNLRCIDWENLSFELMSGQTVAGRVGGDFSLSRPLRKGEIIDFFLSHSWHDDAKEKYAKMTAVVERFRAAKERYPTFWLDKVCIDQSNISDGLKVLPVNVMACSHMLVLWGRTYPYRLWCAWELCTLFSFASHEQASARLKLEAVGDSGDMFDLLRNYDVANAHCYDPNEEMRLRKIVTAVGEDRFNESIRRIGDSPVGNEEHIARSQ